MPSNPSAAVDTLRAPRWERRKESRPAELLAAALEIFVERGFAATRLDDVAARAGVSKGTLYLYYPSKDELFKAVVRGSIVPLIEAFRRDVESSGDSSEALLRRFFTEWWSRFGGTALSGICKLVMAEARNFPEIARFFDDEVIVPGNAVLAQLIDRGIASGEFAPVDVEVMTHLWTAPLVLKGIWMHSIGACVAEARAIEPERFVRAHLQQILHVLRPAGRPIRGDATGAAPALHEERTR